MGYLVHVGFKNVEYQRFASRCAADLGLGYRLVLVKDELFKTGSLIKGASLAVIWNGKQHYSPLAVDLCKQRDIPYVVYEWGLLPQATTFLADPRGFCGDSILCSDTSWINDEDRRALRFMRLKMQSKHPLNPKPKRVLCLLQIENDSQILYYTKYNYMREFVRDMEKEYEGADLEIRPHPKSNAVPPVTHSKVVREGTLLERASQAELVVGLTSTGLYESAILGVPVKAYGNHPLSRNNATDDVLAGLLTLRFDRVNGRLSPILKRLNIVPKGHAQHS